ncbi:hypothetical protein R3P38DRAFT_3357514 [Favolaschia claudopus]|uniref:Uncharacterized protein n=1 Tax=Favolaschia claudopus TaxID=2862362 RepID=A0AAW0B5N1_9AGAR
MQNLEDVIERCGQAHGRSPLQSGDHDKVGRFRERGSQDGKFACRHLPLVGNNSPVSPPPTVGRKRDTRLNSPLGPEAVTVVQCRTRKVDNFDLPFMESVTYPKMSRPLCTTVAKHPKNSFARADCQKNEKL